MDELLSGDELFEIEVDFTPGTGQPSRVFRTMSALIDSVQTLDQHLSATVSTKIQTTLVLEEVKVGSIRARLKNMIEGLPDEALKQGELKKVIGHYLHKAKHKILDWCSKRNDIKDRAEIKQLEGEIVELAKETDVKVVPAYAPIATAVLLSDISAIADALGNLEEGDSAVFISDQGKSEFNRILVISEDVVRDLMTREAIVSEGERILKVKKPDYLGTSKWIFKHSGHPIDAKILHKEWLREFQAKTVSVRPGDSLRAIVKEETLYGYDNEIVFTKYEILKVMEVIEAPTQGTLF